MKKLATLFLSLILLACSQKSSNTNTVSTVVEIDSVSSYQYQLDSITALIDKDTLNALYYFERAELYLANNSLQDGTNDLYKAVALDSLNALYWEKLGVLNYASKDSRSAKNAWEKCAKLDSRNINCRLSLAEIYLAVGEYKKGEKHLLHILDFDAKNSSALFLVGNYALMQADTVKAMKYVQAAINNDQNLFKAYDLMGVLYSAKKDILAIDYFNAALRLKPYRFDVHYKVGMFYQGIEAYPEALEAYDRAISIRSDYDNAYHNKGVIYVFMQDYDKAIVALSKAIEANASYLEAYFARAYTYELSGNILKAESDYRTCIMLDPSYQPAMDGVDRLHE